MLIKNNLLEQCKHQKIGTVGQTDNTENQVFNTMISDKFLMSVIKMQQLKFQSIFERSNW